MPSFMITLWKIQNALRTGYVGILAAGLGAIAMGWLGGCDRPRAGKTPPPPGSIVIDARIPGAKVFFQDQLLGIVPVTLTPAQLSALGISPIGDKPLHLDYDGYGEGIMLVAAADKVEARLTLLAPQPEHYLTFQTPWGLRTKIHGGGISSNECRAVFMRRAGVAFTEPEDSGTVQIENPAPELAISLSGPKIVRRDEQQIEVVVIAKNTSTEPMHWTKAKMDFRWGPLDAAWRKRTNAELYLPETWNAFAPGEERKTTLAVPWRSPAGTYSFFGVLTSHSLATANPPNAYNGATYGDSILIEAVGDEKGK
jgi:hypothetical protein